MAFENFFLSATQTPPLVEWFSSSHDLQSRRFLKL
jgi:hypothetical protein